MSYCSKLICPAVTLAGADGNDSGTSRAVIGCTLLSGSVIQELAAKRHEEVPTLSGIRQSSYRVETTPAYLFLRC